MQKHTSGDAPWRRFYHAEAAGLVDVEYFPLSKLLDDAAALHGARPFLTLGDETLSYSDVAEWVARLAAGLKDLGIRKGDRVGYMGPAHPAFTLTCFALWHLGAVHVGMNPLYSVNRLAGQALDAGLSALLTLDDPALLAKAAEVTSVLDRPIPVISANAGRCDPTADSTVTADSSTGRMVKFRDLTRSSGLSDRSVIDPANDPAALQYTGGTTGTPKAAVLTHGNLASNVLQMTSWFPELEPGREALLAAAPVTHVAGLGPMQNFMTRLAGELVWMSRFEPQHALRLIRDRKVSVLLAPPTMYIALLDAAEGTGVDWSNIRSAQCGASPVPLELKQRFQKATGIWLTTLYGMTETAPAAIYSSTLPEHAAATGIPLPLTEVEIRSPGDPTNRVPAGEAGEICIRGPQVMAGYWKRQQETQSAFVNGFFRSGDIGSMSEDGVVTVLDRLKDMIIASGYNVYPADVENAILQHPLVREAAVIGVPDRYRGETVKAIVSLRQGNLELAELQQFLSDKLSPMEIPKQLELLAEIPKNENLKIAKQALRERELAIKEERGQAPDASGSRT